jgi:ribosomal protein S18 acetylase RimI-like enzyme
MKKTTSKIEFKSLQPIHAEQVAKLHIENISTAFLSSLGIDFLTCLYRSIAQSQWGFGVVAENNGKVVAFIAFATNLNRLYRSVIFRKGLVFILLLASRMVSLRRVKKAVETLLYPVKTATKNLPSAEMLSIVVAPEERRKGLATQLIEKGLKDCKKKGIDKVKMLIATDNIPGNNLYLKSGFERFRRILSHGIPSYVYIAQTNSIRTAGR